MKKFNIFFLHSQRYSWHWKVSRQCAAPPFACTGQMIFHSSNTWVGANPSNPYVPSKTSQPTGNSVVSGSSSFSCAIYVLSESTGSYLWLRLFPWQVFSGLPNHWQTWTYHCRPGKRIGKEYIDEVKIYGLNSSLVIPNQSIGASLNVSYYSIYYL